MPSRRRRETRDYLLLLLQHLHGHLKLPLLLAGLGDGGLVLLLVGHGHHGQDEVHQVEGAQEDHHHEEHHDTETTGCTAKSYNTQMLSYKGQEAAAKGQRSRGCSHLKITL
ncbi:hypothetical protein EYF80_064465 [Liparis tanakae]|uniref:Uncharacterized protein n=1 Tax=Liparis tanakae TaxID=230148 RepID=A0A4Z2E990_9TELE|nr:hypothetical protein EYF80_064465 [Liparis tanakae]